MWAKPKKMLLTYADAYNFALDRLAMRDHSSLELRDKLAERGCDKELQDRVLAALRERHFVDDVRCAGYVVDAWRRKGIYGRNYLRLMLEKRQIPASVVKDMLDGVSEEEERERAEEFARKEVPSFWHHRLFLLLQRFGVPVLLLCRFWFPQCSYVQNNRHQHRGHRQQLQ